MTFVSSARLAAILALAALPAFAADLAPAPSAGSPQVIADHGRPGMGPGGHHRHHRHGAGMLSPERIEGRLAFLKAELKITEAQAPQWNTFADALRAQAKDATARRAERHAAHQARAGQAAPQSGQHAGQQRQAKPLPERMAAMEAMMQRQLQRVQQLRSTVEPLYSVLSPEQRKTADALIARI